MPGRVYIEAEVIPVLKQVFLWSTTNRIALEDLANQTLPSRLKRQRRGRHNSIHEKQWKAEIQKPKLLRKYVLMNSSSPFFIGIAALNLGFFKELPRHEQGVMLLKRLAFLFPQGQTFDPYSVPVWSHGRPNPNGLADGFPTNELREADRYLLVGGPWHEIVDAGYVAEAPPGSRKYEITDEGWDVVESNTVEVDDDYITTILP